MNKEELLRELSLKVNLGEITQEEVKSRVNLVQDLHASRIGVKEKINKAPHFSVTKILYILGAAIVIIGTIIFIVQIWEDLGSFGRIIITLGLGLIITAIGSVLLKQKPSKNIISIGSIFHVIGGVLIPSGALVTINELNVDMSSAWPFAITFGIIFVFYLLLNTVHKNAILTFFAIANGTAFIYFLTEAIIDGPFYRHDDIYAYLTMAIGISYILLATAFRGGRNKVLVRVLYFLGTAGFFGAAFTRVFDSLGWQLLYFILVFVGIFLSIYVKSRIILMVSILYLLAHITYITNEYFADSFGWPISLVILGFIFIGLGYVSVSINQKYIKVK